MMNILMKKQHKISSLLVVLMAVFMSIGCYAQKSYKLQSLDKTIEVNVVVGNQITYSVSVDNRLIVAPSKIALITELNDGSSWKVKKIKEETLGQTLHPVVPQKSSIIVDSCRQMTIGFNNGLTLIWRVYNNGVAWHWGGNAPSGIKVTDETAQFNFDKSGRTWYPEESEFYSHNERRYHLYGLDTVGNGKLASLPALFESNGVKVLLTESSLFHYPGMWVRSGTKGNMNAVFPHYPKQTKIEGDRDEKVVSREDYLSKDNDLSNFPWRILMLARHDKELLDNQLVYQLAKPSEGDYSWVKPGKVQWDWWHYNNVYNVPFRAGVNNDTYKYYIDFASKNHIEYVMLDEGWSDTRDLLKQAEGIDIEELVQYGKAKNVGVLLWMSWLTLDQQMQKALDQFQQWGIKGIKIDFMQRDDQPMVEYYEKIAIEAARRHLLVDFHGAYKPTGWLRTFPNVMTSEGVYGNEQSKFSPTITPGHTATIPYIRMAAGPMDFTPGGMNNVLKGQFAAEPSEPMTPGTRCNQMAMYVIFESPLQMLCDIPTHYIENPECMEFLSAVPSVWRQTVPLDGEVGYYTVMAREALNGDWYIGAMTDWDKRSLTIKLDFLPIGKYKMLVWKDGVNADRNAKDFQMETLVVDASTSVPLHLSIGGGYVARLIKM